MVKIPRLKVSEAVDQLLNPEHAVYKAMKDKHEAVHDSFDMKGKKVVKGQNYETIHAKALEYALHMYNGTNGLKGNIPHAELVKIADEAIRYGGGSGLTSEIMKAQEEGTMKDLYEAMQEGFQRRAEAQHVQMLANYHIGPEEARRNEASTLLAKTDKLPKKLDKVPKYLLANNLDGVAQAVQSYHSQAKRAVNNAAYSQGR